MYCFVCGSSLLLKGVECFVGLYYFGDVLNIKFGMRNLLSKTIKNLYILGTGRLIMTPIMCGNDKINLPADGVIIFLLVGSV